MQYVCVYYTDALMLGGVDAARALIRRSVRSFVHGWMGCMCVCACVRACVRAFGVRVCVVGVRRYWRRGGSPYLDQVGGFSTAI